MIKVCEYCNKHDRLQVTYSTDWCNRCNKFAYGKYVYKLLYYIKRKLKII